MICIETIVCFIVMLTIVGVYCRMYVRFSPKDRSVYSNIQAPKKGVIPCRNGIIFFSCTIFYYLQVQLNCSSLSFPIRMNYHQRQTRILVQTRKKNRKLFIFVKRCKHNVSVVVLSFCYCVRGVQNSFA